MFWSIKYIQNIEIKTWQNCEFLSIFLTKEGLNEYIKFFRKMELWDELEKEEVFVKCSVKKVFLKMSQYLQENTFVGVSFLIKMQASCLQAYLKRDFNTCVFLRILWNFLRTLSLKNASGGCFYTKDSIVSIFCKEKILKQIFFQLSGLTSSNIGLWQSKVFLSKNYSFIWILTSTNLF